MARTPAQAVADASNDTAYKTGMCLQWVRIKLGVAAKYPTAAAAWNATKKRKTGTPPAGYPVWWTGGSRGFGHVALSAGGGYVYSTDVPSSGRVGKIAISTLTSRWGQTYRGWSLDINGVTLPDPTPAKPVVDLSQLVAAARSNPSRKDQKVTYSGAKLVESALVKERLLAARYSDGHFGRMTIRAYSQWQRRLGYRGKDSDGLPGYVSLKRLGDKYGFDVTQ